MPDLAALADHKSELIRKALEGSIFVAPFSAAPITTMTSGPTMDLTALPTDYKDVGFVEKSNAVTWSRSVTSEEILAWGDIYPVRRDVTKDDSSLKFTMLETGRQAMELYFGVDLSATVPDPVTSEVAFNQPSRPTTIFYRMMAIFQDGAGTDAIYVGRFYPRCSVTDMTDQKWSDDTDPVAWDVSVSAVTDTTLGYPVRHFFGGPGWANILADTGFGPSS